MEQKLLVHKVKKRKATRIAYRCVGIVFFCGGIFLLMWAMSSSHLAILKSAVGISCATYGFWLMKASFRKSAFDATYIFGENHLLIQQKNWNSEIPYGEITDIQMVTPDPAMAYYLLKIQRKKESYVLPFLFNKQKCETILGYVLERSEINEREDTSDIGK